MVMETKQEEIKPVEKLADPIQPTMVQEAREVLKQLKEANAITKELVERQERLKAEDLLGGRTSGVTPQPEVKEESSRDYAEKALAGDLDV